MNERRRLGTLLLAASGVVIGHAVTYAVLGVALGKTHNYLGNVAQILLPAGLGAAALLTLRVARKVNLNRRELKFGHLAAIQVGLFLSQELAEAAVSSGGIGHLMPSVIMVGIASQLFVAVALYWAIDGAARAVARLAGAAALFRPNVVSAQLHWSVATIAGRLVHGDVKSRGPPSLFGI